MAAKDHRRPDEGLAQQLIDEPNFLREIVERVLQQLLEAQMDQHIGAAPYERSESRTGQRNGYKPRMLRTRVGTLNLLVPQDREETFSTSLFARYQRNEKALAPSLMEIAGSYPYLFVDARYEKVRAGSRIISEGVLVVCGVRDDGFREILAVDVADVESETTYQALFRSLKERGLSGVELVTSDNHQGLKAAIARHFHGASHQRCQVHFSRNLMERVSFDKRKELAADLRTIFDAPERGMAMNLAESVAEKWRESYPKVAEHLEEYIEECLSCLAFPESHRRRIRSTNGLERVNQEIRRRSRVVRIFPNRASCLRLATAVVAEISEEWVTGKRYLNMAELAAQREREVTMS